MTTTNRIGVCVCLRTLINDAHIVQCSYTQIDLNKSFCGAPAHPRNKVCHRTEVIQNAPAIGVEHRQKYIPYSQ